MMITRKDLDEILLKARQKDEAASLYGLQMPGANLTGVNFSNAKLHGADLKDCVLDEANFSRADLSNAQLSGCSLRYANFTDADLTFCSLGGADLTCANLSGAHLINVMALDANFTNVDFGMAVISGRELRGACLIPVTLGSRKIFVQPDRVSMDGGKPYSAKHILTSSIQDLGVMDKNTDWWNRYGKVLRKLIKVVQKEQRQMSEKAAEFRKSCPTRCSW